MVLDLRHYIDQGIPLLVNFQESGRWRDLTYSGSEESLDD